MPLLAIDPGRAKHGLAVVGPDGVCLARAVVGGDELLVRLREWQERFRPQRLLLGGGTGHREVLASLTAAGFEVEIVPERDTTRRARARYFQEFPPCGWRRWLPRGLLIPPRPIDDFAALILAEDALARG